MTISKDPREQAELLRKAFAGKRLKEVLEVVVCLGDDHLALSDTAIFVFEDGIIQVLTDVHEKRCMSLRALDNVVVVGEYPDRTGVDFRKLTTGGMDIGRLYAVWEVGPLSNSEHLVGMILADKAGSLRFGLNVHLDDLIWSDAETFWKYVGSIWASTSSVRLSSFGGGETK